MRYATLILLLLAAPIRAAAPIFENGTPVGFVTPDSTTTQDFVSGATVEIRVDLNQAATDDHPVIGHFHSLERSEQLSTTDTDGSWVDVAMWDEAPFGTVSGSINAIHMAWIEASTSTTGPAFTGGSTPAYEVYYARSEDGGASFSSPLSVSAGLSYYVLSVDGAGSSFSTLDLEVDSRGNPRVTYAFVTTADHSANRNVYFAYSDSGGHSWKTPISVNDVSTIGTEGTASAFPRMVVDDRDEIFIAYERGTDAATGDIILAKVNRTTSPFSMEAIGSLGTVGSAGGVRLTVDGKRHTGVDLALGDDDALHAVYFSDADNRIEYKRAATDDSWLDVSADGWDRDVDGSVVGSFVDEAAGNTALDVDVTHFFPTIVVDRQRLPDRVYSVYKYADSTPIEGIYLNQYDDDGSTGASATWGTATTAWSTGATPLFADGLGEYGPELDWFHTERVAAFVDDRL
ncbi:MAG: exo-alpha-sialidase, partial [Gemmatimonadetes bacterium]|nr:exo-alpha-sialidase [Gemmatimonadota bacterium]